MEQAPIIFVVSEPDELLEEALRRRYIEGYQVLVTAPDRDPVYLLRSLNAQNMQIALMIVEGVASVAVLRESGALYPNTVRLLLANPDKDGLDAFDVRDYTLVQPWTPVVTHLYPILDELLAEWRASVNRSFSLVSGIMTVRTVRIRISDSLHRAAEVIALSGVGDLMVIDNDNNFVGVLSVGDVLRAAMPDFDEITEEGGTLDQAFRLFLRKGSELMYKPIQPLVITQPLVVDPDDHVAKAAALMLEKNIHRLPVVKDGRLVGTVGRTDICQAVVGTL